MRRAPLPAAGFADRCRRHVGLAQISRLFDGFEIFAFDPLAFFLFFRGGPVPMTPVGMDTAAVAVMEPCLFSARVHVCWFARERLVQGRHSYRPISLTVSPRVGHRAQLARVSR